MSKLLLLVQTENHVAHLDAAAKAILSTNIKGVWCVFSPAVLVNTSEAAATLDAEIAQLTSAERAAADRGDYTAAAGYKVQREGKVLDRAKEIRDAHKKLTSEQRTTRTKELFAPFHAQLQAGGRNAKISSHSDHYDPEQWVAMLNSLSGVWFKEFTPGSFVVGWPESVETAIGVTAPQPDLRRLGPTSLDEQKFREQSNPVAPQRLPQVPPVPKTRREELEAMHHMTLRQVGKQLGLDIQGKGKDWLVENILTVESPALATGLAPTVDALATY